MNTSSVRTLRNTIAFVAGAALAVSAFAQTAPDAKPEETKKVVTLEKFTVTGSNIPSTLTAGEAGALPVVSLDTKAIEATGYQTAADLLQKITVSNGGSVPISNNATGFTPAAASTSIHGLGPEATLVLINGHRVADYPIGQGGQVAFVDLNSIPLSAVEKIEVLTSGASAIYGADAVAGVVNIIFKKNYEGAALNLRYANTSGTDSHELVANYVQGVSDDKGSMTAGMNYYYRAAIFQANRPYSAIAPYLSSNSVPINAQITLAAYDEALHLAPGTKPAGVSGTVFYASPGVTPGAAGGNTQSPNGVIIASTNVGTTPANQYIYSGGRTSYWDFNQTAGSYPSFERHGGFLNGERKLFGTDNIKGYFDMSYTHNFSESQLAPLATGTFTTPGSIELVIPSRTPNPLPTPDGRARAAAAGAYNPFNPFNVDLTGGTKFRLYDFGNRILKTDTDSFVTTVGMKMNNLADKWNVDLGARFSSIQVHQDFLLASTSRFNQIVNAASSIFNPASSSYIGTTTPYDPFGYVTPIATNAPSIAYARVHVKDQFTSWLRNPFATLSTGDLFELPAGNVGFALGVDIRAETVQANPDALSVIGDVAGSGAENQYEKTRKVYAYFGELSLPIFSPKQNVAGFHSLSLDVAAREENFVTQNQSKMVPQAAISWKPIDDTFLVRGGYGKGIRQPSIYELYSGTSYGLATLTDPRSGATVAEVPTVSGSNSSLKAETTSSLTAGIVWSPKAAWLKGFTTNVDYWKVERDGTVVSNPQDTLNRFFHTSPGGLVTGEKVTLDAQGNILAVNAPYINVGKTVASGFDLGASYAQATANWGHFDYSLGGSYLWHFKQAVVLGTPLQELVGTDASGGQGMDGYLRWKGKATIDWNFKSYAVGIVGNYTAGFLDYDPNGDPYMVKSLTTVDVRLGYTLHNELGSYLADTTITIGALNVFNKTPPYSSGGGSNSAGYPGFMYDSTDRFMYVQLGKKF